MKQSLNVYIKVFRTQFKWGWISRTVSDVCAKALKERGVGLLNRANEYLINSDLIPFLTQNLSKERFFFLY